MPSPLKQTISALQEAVELSQASGEPVPLDVEVDLATLDVLAFVLGHSVSCVELEGGGVRLVGKGPGGGEFTLQLKSLRNPPNPKGTATQNFQTVTDKGNG